MKRPNRHITDAGAWRGLASRRVLALFVMVVACAFCSRSVAQTVVDVSTGFNGTIASGTAINLIAPGGVLDGNVVNNGQLWFNNPDVSPQSVPYSISGTGLIVLWQPITLTFSGPNTYAGGTIIYDGVTTIAGGGSIYHPSGDLDLDGVSGTTLNINGSLTNANAHLGLSGGSYGDVNVAAGGMWSTQGTLYAGFSGTSAVVITGGTTSANEAYFGYNAGGGGSLSQSGGLLQTAGGLYFGYFGDATLSLTGGTIASASDLYFSYGPGSATGTITSGTMSAANTFTVGKNGSGSLLVDGGFVTATDGVLGQSGGGVGVVTVNSGSIAFSDTLEVGSTTGGNGTLTINGGGVTSGLGYIGNLGGSQGQVNVAGGSLRLTGTNPEGNLQVGYLGTGLLSVTSGSVSAVGGGIGWGSTGSGTVAISGGSLSVTNEFDIGQFGKGLLTLSNGTLSTDQVILGKGNHLGVIGSGTAIITGGTWNNSLSLTIGQMGNGTMSVSGGRVTAPIGYIGSADTLATTGAGSLTVTGGTVSFDGNLYVGNAFPGSTGSGTLTVSGSSGVVTVNGTLYRATNGTINLNSGGTLSIGIGQAAGALETSIVDNGLLIFNRSTASTHAYSISGTGAVTKQGSGTLTLTATSSYTGATTVESGTLVLNGALGVTPMSVLSGATLAGNGSTEGTVSISNGGFITPGAESLATLTVGGLDFAGSSATAIMQITGSSAGQYDQILAQVGSPTSLAWGNGALSLTMSTTPSYETGTVFHLFANFSQYTGNVSVLELIADGTDFAGFTFSKIGDTGLWKTQFTAQNQALQFDANTGNLVVVPEPTTVVLCFVGVSLLGIYSRRTRRIHQQAQASA